MTDDQKPKSAVSPEPTNAPPAAVSQLQSDEILTTEYAYIAQSAFQANEDRARVSTYYVVTFGTLVAALFSLRVDNADLTNIHTALFIVFLALALFGLSTLLQLVRLRQAWRESILAMTRIKDYYIKKAGTPDLAGAFLWRESTIPPHYKPWSIGFLMALQVALLGGVSLGAAVYFLGLVTASWTWWPAIAAGLLYFSFQVWLYRRILNA
jgi:hypothetical protein